MNESKSTELRRALKEFARTSTLLALALFAVDVLLYVLMIAGIFVFESAVLKMGCSVGAGLVISSLFVIGHDAAHNSYTSSKRLNTFISYVAFFPALHNYSLWRVAHSRFHHVHTNQKGMNSWSPLSKSEYDNFPVWRRFVEQIYRSPLGIGIYYMVERWWKYKFFPTRRAIHGLEGNYWKDFSLILSFIVIYAGALGYLGSVSAGSTAFSGIMLGFVLPFIVWNYAMGLTVYLQHTNQRTPWFDDAEEADGLNGQEEVTVHVIFPEWYGFISHYIMEHTAHHVLPTIPMYHLKEAQKRLKELIGDSMIQEKFSFSYLFHTIGVCKIYDYKRHQWQNFKGEYTSDCTLPDGMKDKEIPLDGRDVRDLKYA